MSNESGIMQRAFELARVSTCRSVEDVRIKLRQEGFEQVDAHIAGSAAKQLKRIMVLRHLKVATSAQ